MCQGRYLSPEPPELVVVCLLYDAFLCRKVASASKSYVES